MNHEATTMERLGNWILGERLGRGGNGSVRKVHRDGEPSTPFALKRLNNPKRESSRERFEREQRALALVKHRGIIRLVEPSGDGPSPFYVMEYIDGAVDLARLIWDDRSDDRIDRTPLGALEFVAAVADGVHAAHEAGIVHRDLKPGNILVRPDGSPVLIDFGCCQIEEDLDQLTLDDEGVGARNFMAYECEAGIGGSPSAESDVFSLGKILWCMVTGAKPFAGEPAGFIEQNRLDLRMPEEPDAGFLVDAMLVSVRRRKEDRCSTAALFAAKCRELALEIRAGGKHPLFTHRRCPLCMSTNIRAGSNRLHHPSGEGADMAHFIGTNNRRFEGVWCFRCGHVGVRDPLMHQERQRTLALAAT